MLQSLQIHKKHRSLLLIILLVIINVNSFAQEINLREIPSLDKLPVNAIHRIYQDSDGYMWYGTFNGLCRYDGYNIKTIRSDFKHPNLLADNYITYIIEDHEKHIWFGTLKGAYILDKSTFHITPVNLEGITDKNVFTINVTKDGSIWISVKGALLQFKSDGTLIRKHIIEYNNQPDFVYLVYEDKAGDLLISIPPGGLYKFNKEKDSFEPYFPHPQYKYIERIIWYETHNCYWLGTWGHGIIRFDPTNQNQPYTPQPLPVDILGNPTGNLFHMVQDDVLNYLWVTTQKNLFAFRIKEDGNLEQVDTSPFLPAENKILYEIIKDKEGKLWVSAFDNKSFIVDIRKHITKEYPLTALRQQIMANPSVTALCFDKKDMLWFSQERYGLCTYDLKENKIKHYQQCEDTKNLPFWDVIAFNQSKTSNRVWTIAMNETIYGLRQENMDIKVDIKIQLHDAIENAGRPTTLYEDSKNNLWIGTSNSLFKYHIPSKKLSIVSKDLGYISGISQTSEENIWVAIKNKGICHVNSEIQTKIYPASKDFVCIDATSDGILWIGTAQGEILKFNSENGNIEDYSIPCGMKGDIINNIVVDEYNHLWIITNQLIKEYNPNNSAYRVFNTRNPDFLLDRLLPKAVFYNQREKIFFGGISGIVSISPSQQLEGIPEHVITYITDVKVMDKSILNDTTKTKFTNNGIVIDPQDQNIEIAFSSLDFHNLEQVRYAYRLKGIDNEWVILNEGKNTAFYNKLPKGTYTFQVKATDKHGLWSNEITELTIIRLPFWYESSWAYLIYIFLATAILGYIIYINRKRIELQSRKKWADSAELVKMHQYLEQNKNQQSHEFKELDQMLIDKATKAVLEHLGDSKFNVETLAESMNMSRSTLSRKIKLITGKTAFDFIKQIKMHQACQLLESKTATINDVMIALGYNDYKSFTNSFKSIYGVSPSEYQKNAKS
ncbi:two-component regulator propeller domain-containing protein [Carboxylicivirga linearis]|uniref:Helix-turn-helix domain-containing protein n=1 Tax=Carboxylicivirga linearis TaxID=1628157 RepID=A0ABS5JXM4_9BACT|nr:two-component regulator propeller domain-containing protein [Carboxylicivirga linearis]MBS2099583.1 helix-turn-helix domain-containing protein [Carboxylicivirga linearis]